MQKATRKIAGDTLYDKLKRSHMSIYKQKSPMEHFRDSNMKSRYNRHGDIHKKG